MSALFDSNAVLLTGLAAAWCLEYPEADPHSTFGDLEFDLDDHGASQHDAQGSTAAPVGMLKRTLSKLSIRSLTSPSPKSPEPAPSTALVPATAPCATVLQTTWDELAVMAAFGSHQVQTLANGIMDVATTGAARPSWNKAMHIGVYLVRSNFAFNGISIPRLRLWSGRVGAGASSLPHGVQAKEVTFTVDRDQLMTFEDQGAEWRKGKQAERYPTVLPENAKKWDAASRVYDLKGEWIEYDDKIPPPRDELFGFRRWAGSWIRRQPKEEPSQTPTPPPERERRDKVIYFLHGGAYIGGTTQLYRLLSGRLAKETNCKVFALDYRLAPEHAFPAALHDAFTGYLYMINPQHSCFKHLNPAHDPIDPKDIILMGDSAGGGLVMCLLNYLNLYLRSPTGQHLVPLPSGAALMSPWVDLAFTSESWSTNATFDWLPSNARQIHDHIVPGVPHPVYMYLYGEDSPNPPTDLIGLYPSNPLDSEDASEVDSTCAAQFIRDRVEQFVRHPLVSPIFAETYAGLPPILIQAGEAEVLRDDSLALAFKYDRDNVGRHGFKGWVRHEMFTDMVHIFVMMSWTKESTSAMQRINYFLDELEVGHPLEPICVEDDVTVDSHVSL